MPPVILIFDPGGVTPSDDHDCEEVVALGDQLGEVELGRKSRIFSHSDEFSIAPHSGEALCPAEVHDDIARSPVARNGEGCSVEACRIVFRNIGRFLTRPGHYDVGVVGEVIEALACPHTRYGDGCPSAVICGWMLPLARSR